MSQPTLQGPPTHTRLIPAATHNRHTTYLEHKEASNTDSTLAAFPTILSLLEAWLETRSQYHLDHLYTPPLSDCPPLVVCISRLYPHTRVLFIMPSFSNPTPKNGNILAFSWYIINKKIPAPVEVHTNCLETYNVSAPLPKRYSVRPICVPYRTPTADVHPDT